MNSELIESPWWMRLTASPSRRATLRTLTLGQARTVYACATHGVLSPPAIDRISASPIEELIITDTIPLRPDTRACPKIKILPVARLLGEAVKRIHHGDSISSLFI